MTKQAYNLPPLWDAILDVYKAFAEVCNRHGLRYYVTGGTLLGAARHKGFIPWDDDFDVVMPRRDYRKFFDVYAEELSRGFRAYDFRTKRDTDVWDEMFGKVCATDDNLAKKIRCASNLDLKQGIFIDVIPIDGYPTGKIAFKWWYFLRTVKRCIIGYGNIPQKFRFLVPVLKMLFGFYGDKRHNAIKFEEWLMRCDYDTSLAVDDYNTNLRRLKTRSLCAKSFGAPVMMPFGNIEVPCPQKWNEFLTLIYTDWRKLPPEECRHPMHQIMCTRHED